MDFAATSVLRSVSTLLISGFAAPARTTMPISERASSTLLSARTNPRLPSSSAAPPSRITTSAASPRVSRVGIASGESPIDGPRVVTKAVTACALESGAQLGIDSIKTGGDHHTHVGRGCGPRHQNGGDAKRGQPANN
jgi:hypothetical protein